MNQPNNHNNSSGNGAVTGGNSGTQIENTHSDPRRISSTTSMKGNGAGNIAAGSTTTTGFTSARLLNAPPTSAHSVSSSDLSSVVGSKGIILSGGKLPWDISSKSTDKRKYLIAPTSHTEAISK